MSLSSLYLDAFAEVAKEKSFSKAAKKLHVTQSALSQRVLNLESELGSSLFIRDPSGLRLTDLGQRLLRYCHSRTLLESEFLTSLEGGATPGLSGLVRIGGFSTVNRSVVLPLVADFLEEHPRVKIDVRTQELRDLPPLLFSGATDLILVAQPVAKHEVENHLLGYEEYVLVQSPKKNARRDLYFDHDEEDATTTDFFKQQSRKAGAFERSFLGDIYAIIDAVEMGLGRAVVPVHLIRETSRIEVVPGLTPLRMPVYLCFFTQAFFTDLQKAAIELIRDGFGEHLAPATRAAHRGRA